MHIEFRHLRTIKAIHEFGGLARAAEQLNITQSALSHQIKGIEDQAGIELFVRRSKPLKLSAAGLRLLRAAERILPEIDALQAEFSGLRAGHSGRMHIAIECHACFEWLFPVLENFRKTWGDVVRPRGFARRHLYAPVRLQPGFRGLQPAPFGAKTLYPSRRFSR